LRQRNFQAKHNNAGNTKTALIRLEFTHNKLRVVLIILTALYERTMQQERMCMIEIIKCCIKMFTVSEEWLIIGASFEAFK
jgi:hypothetical protein